MIYEPQNWQEAYDVIVEKFNLPNVDRNELIEVIEMSFQLGLDISNKEKYFFMNRKLIELYMKGEYFDKAVSRLLILQYKPDCPAWVHLCLSRSMIYTDTLEFITEDPKFFLEHLSTAISSSDDNRESAIAIVMEFLDEVEKKGYTMTANCSCQLDSFIQRYKKDGDTNPLKGVRKKPFADGTVCNTEEKVQANTSILQDDNISQKEDCLQFNDENNPLYPTIPIEADLKQFYIDFRTRIQVIFQRDLYTWLQTNLPLSASMDKLVSMDTMRYWNTVELLKVIHPNFDDLSAKIPGFHLQREFLQKFISVTQILLDNDVDHDFTKNELNSAINMFITFMKQLDFTDETITSFLTFNP